MSPNERNGDAHHEANIDELAEDINSYKVQFKQENSNNEGIRGGTKGSIQFQLGTFKAFLPFIVYLTGLTLYYRNYFNQGNTTVNIPMSRKPFMEDYVPVFILSCLYVTFSLYWGPLLMQNRKPIRLKKTMMVYNLFQVCICSYLFIEGGLALWFHCIGLMDHDPLLREKPCNFPYCEPEDTSDSPYNQRVANFVYLYLATKLLDWMDTIFFVLQKKWSHISLLHVFHHMGMFYGVWWFAKYIGSGHYTFAGFVNAFVHVVLYLYYFLALLGPKVRKYLWWKKYLTMLQLSQFLIAVVYVPMGMYNDCGLNIHIQYNGMIYAVVFLYLFGDFYATEYNKKPEKTDVDGKISNGESPSETNGTLKVELNEESNKKDL